MLARYTKLCAVAFLIFGTAVHAADKTITVAADGSGDFKTVQEAIAAAPAKSAEQTTVRIKAGTYTGPFIVGKEKQKLSFVGDGATRTILTWDRNVKLPIPDGGNKFNPGLWVNADDFSAKDLTIQNTAGDWGQALAVRVDSDRATFENCRLLGWQDTLMVNNGRSYFENCHIEGRVDFIYGSGTGVFQGCEILSKNGGFITAASTPENVPFGLVFLKCKLIGDPKPWNPATTNPASTQQMARPDKMAYLGRPWRPTGMVAFLNCQMGDHIRPEGWDNWGRVSNEQTARYREYKNTGPGAKPAARVKWSKQLTDAEAAEYTVKNILGGKDQWDPTVK